MAAIRTMRLALNTWNSQAGNRPAAQFPEKDL
jgi:hypothetical protein